MAKGENWKEELDLYFWKMMKIERCIRSVYTTLHEYRFPNGIVFKTRPSGNRFDIEAHVEYSGEITNRLGKIWHTSSTKKNQLKVNGECPNRGILLDLIWDIYSIGSD